MRGKIIAVFSVIVALTSLVWFALLRSIPPSQGNDVTSEVRRSLHSAAQTLELEAVRLERWTSQRVTDPKLREPFEVAAPNARGETATALASDLFGSLSNRASELSGVQIQVVLLVDARGIVLGRNGSALMRGEDLGGAHLRLRQTLQQGTATTDHWVNRARSEQWLTAFAPIRSAAGEVLGALVVGASMGDDRLSRIRELGGEASIFMALPAGDHLDIVSKSQGGSAEFMQELARSSRVASLLAGAQAEVDLTGVFPGWVPIAVPMPDAPGGSGLVLLGVLKQRSGGIPNLPWMALGITAFGLVLVMVAAIRVSDSLSAPIAEIEDRLLSILNGRVDLRIETEHPELGGVVFRINSLLNQLLGVNEEAATDPAPGAVSAAAPRRTGEPPAPATGGDA